MKRRELVQHLHSQGCELLREVVVILGGIIRN